MRLHNKVALITGAASGIGEGIVRLFAEHGARVLATDINDEAGRQLVQNLAGDCHYQHLDVSRMAEWRDAVAWAEENLGPIDIMVHSAGISFPADIETVGEAAWHQHMNVHGLGTMLGCQTVIESMKKLGKGAIINISSVESIRPGPLFVAYGAAKAAMDAVTKTVALHCGEKGYNIRVNSVHPAATRTPLVQQYLDSAEDPVALEKIYAGMQPLGRIAEVSEIASAVLFLASDEASFMTGHQMYVDGGVLAKPYPAGEGA